MARTQFTYFRVSFAPPAIVQNAAKEAIDVVEANQYR